MEDFLFSKITELGKPFDGLIAGSFTAMSGSKAEIFPKDLATIVENTNAAIQSTATESGEVVGFPIDEEGHDHKGGAGWIVKVELEGDKIRFIPNWTERGKQLIGDNIRRFFSASIDLKNKVILGGSLTNYPASRFSNGKIALRPVELSQELHSLDIEPSEGFIKEFAQKLIDAISGLSANDEAIEKGNDMDLNEYAQTDEGKAELAALVNAKAESRATELADKMVATQLADAKRNAGILEFAEEVTNGEEKALPLETSRVAEFLGKLPPELVEEAQAILSEVLAAGTLDFSEQGHAKTLQGKAEFPAELAGTLNDWIGEGNSIKEFFAINAAELGAQSDYNLTEFTVEEK